MENAEEIFNFLEDFSKRKPKTIPQELNEYLAYVARTGDPVYQWSLVRPLFKEKLVSVITDFYETSPGIDIPPYPNVDPFNYDSMKNALLERLDSFASAPFTVQRICELLTYPRKQYNRVDKFMRAVEKNILVVSTREPGIQRHPEPENGEPNEPIVNGSDNNSEYNVDVEMEDMSWKDNAEQQSSEPQPGSSDAHISVDDIEARLKAKQDAPMETQDKIPNQYESVTPPELNVSSEQQSAETKSANKPDKESVSTDKENKVAADTSVDPVAAEVKADIEMKTEASAAPSLIIPEIKVDDAEMTEQRLSEESAAEKVEETSEKEPVVTETKELTEVQPVAMDESSSDSTSKEDTEPKHISEVSTSSEESSSSSDNTDGNSNSPKTDERHIDVQEESNQSDTLSETTSEENNAKEPEKSPETVSEDKPVEDTPKVTIQREDYSISDLNVDLPELPKHPDYKKIIAEREEVERKEAESKEPESKEAEQSEAEKSDSVEAEKDKTEP